MTIPSKYQYRKKTNNVISNTLNLANALGVSESELKRISRLKDSEKYEIFYITKNDGRQRQIHKPCKDIRNIQRRINHRIFKEIVIWPEYLYGSVPKQKDIEPQDYVNCAKNHCGSKSILKLDIQDFFDNISENLVKNIFLNFFKYKNDVANILTSICCVDSKVPQGGLTSSYLASLCLYSIEPKMVLRLHNKKLKYTRFVDDMTISSTKENFDFSAITNVIESTLNSLDLPLNKQKIQVQKLSSEPMKVHNLRVDFSTPRYDKKEYRRIKSAIHRLSNQKEILNYRTHYFYRTDHNRCVGLVNKLARVNHPSHTKLLKKLSNIKPLPNPNDLNYIKKSIMDLMQIFESSHKTYEYRNKFFRIQQRIAFIRSHPKKIYESSAVIWSNRLQNYRPPYEEK